MGLVLAVRPSDPQHPGGDGIAWPCRWSSWCSPLRAILYPPFVQQVRTTKKMQEINPQLQAIRKKYAKGPGQDDEEMQKLQKEHGFNPLLGCPPMFMQIPVFIGLFHVLRLFNRMGTGMGQLGMGAEETRSIGNYVQCRPGAELPRRPAVRGCRCRRT